MSASSAPPALETSELSCVRHGLKIHGVCSVIPEVPVALSIPAKYGMARAYGKMSADSVNECVGF